MRTVRIVVFTFLCYAHDQVLIVCWPTPIWLALSRGRQNILISEVRYAQLCFISTSVRTHPPSCHGCVSVQGRGSAPPGPVELLLSEPHTATKLLRLVRETLLPLLWSHVHFGFVSYDENSHAGFISSLLLQTY